MIERDNVIFSVCMQRRYESTLIFINLIKILRSVDIELFKCILRKCFDLICILLHFYRLEFIFVEHITAP